MDNSFGKKLKEIRRAKKISQRELASKVEVDFSYISKIENNRLPPPSAETIIKICKVLDISPEFLLSESGKISNDIKQFITSSPEILLFLDELKSISFNKEKWTFLKKQLKKLQ